MKQITVVLFAFCAAALFMPQYAQAQPADAFRQEGIASWYGPEFDGRPTASGEIFNSSLLTAAHPSLPFGTMLKVTNRHNGKQVTVRVTDRGPFVSARIIDVSKAAAEQLDMIVTGTAPVLIESVDRTVISNPGRPAPQSPPPRTSAQPAPDSYWTLPPASAAPVAVAPVAPAASVVPTASAAPVPAPQTTQPLNNQQPAPQVSAPVPAAQPFTNQQPAPVYSQPPAYPQPVQPIIIYAAPTAPAMPVAATPSVAAVSVPHPQTQITAGSTMPNKTYRIQVGAYKIPKNAVDAFEKLKNAGLNPAYERSGEYFRVVLAGIPGTEVQSVTEKAGLAGFGDAVVREER